MEFYIYATCVDSTKQLSVSSSNSSDQLLIGEITIRLTFFTQTNCFHVFVVSLLMLTAGVYQTRKGVFGLFFVKEPGLLTLNLATFDLGETENLSSASISGTLHAVFRQASGNRRREEVKN